MRRWGDMFSGGGGTTAGIELAGGAVAWAANHSKTAVHWHHVNHPGTDHYCQDLMQMDFSRVASVDHLHASPQCPGSSSASQPARKGTGGSHRPDPKRARAKGVTDRNTALSVLAAADVLRPQSITVENVLGMRDWAIFGTWRHGLESLGYHLVEHELNALDFGGAQDRSRLVITACLSGPIELEVPNVAPRTIGDCLDPAGLHRWSEIDRKTPRTRALIRKAQRDAGAQCFVNNVGDGVRGRSWDEPFPTATKKSYSQFIVIDGERCRIIGSRELARSMSFDDAYQLPATKEAAGILIGNAMDVRLSRSMAEQVHQAA